MNVSLYTGGAFGQDMAYKTIVLPLVKGAGGILNNAHFIQRLPPRTRTLYLVLVAGASDVA